MASSRNQLQNLPKLLPRLSPYCFMLHVEQSFPIHQGYVLSTSWVSTSGSPMQCTLSLRSFWFLEKDNCFFSFFFLFFLRTIIITFISIFRGLSRLLIFTIATRGWIFVSRLFFLNKTKTGFYHMAKAAVLVAPTENQTPLGCGRWAVGHLLASLVTCSCPYISHCALSQPVYSVPQRN